MFWGYWWDSAVSFSRQTSAWGHLERWRSHAKHEIAHWNSLRVRRISVRFLRIFSSKAHLSWRDAFTYAFFLATKVRNSKNELGSSCDGMMGCEEIQFWPSEDRVPSCPYLLAIELTSWRESDANFSRPHREWWWIPTVSESIRYYIRPIPSRYHSHFMVVSADSANHV